MGGQAPSASEGTAKMLQSYLQYLPALMQSTSSQQPAIEQQQYDASAGVSPQYSALGLQQLQNYAQPYAQVGQDVQRSNALAGSDTNLATILGPGGAAAMAGNALTNQIDPQLAAAKEQSQNLTNSVNLGGLSGGETAAVERSLNQQNQGTGNLGLNNATNTVSNAMNFGNALQQKQTTLGNALNTAANVTNSATTAFNPVATALAQPASQTAGNFGTSNLTPITTPGNQSYGFGNSALGNISSTYNNSANNAFQSSMANSPMGIFSGVTSGIGNLASCCFIFLEAYNGVLPWWVRRSRDRYYARVPQVAEGYKRMARWLVPAMRASSVVRFAVQRWMVAPLTLYGGFTHRVEDYRGCRSFRVYRRFWFTVWNFLGR